MATVLNPQAREELVRAHLPLVRAVASRYRGLGLPYDDLIQEGSIGLLDAIDRFDPAGGIDFATFAGWRVRRAVLNALTEQSRLIRLPKQVVESRRALARADARLTAATGHAPSDRELAVETGLPASTIANGRRTAPVALSIDEPVSTDGAPLGSVLADPAARDPEEETLAHEEARLLDEALAHLTDRQREVVSRHFGLDGPAAPIARVAAGLDLSRQRTRAIERDALYELRESLESAGLAR